MSPDVKYFIENEPFRGVAPMYMWELAYLRI
jgi:hypothetical protein